MGLEGNRMPGGKVMAGYRRVDGLKVTYGLTACTQGSAPVPTLGNEYGKT